MRIDDLQHAPLAIVVVFDDGQEVVQVLVAELKLQAQGFGYVTAVLLDVDSTPVALLVSIG